MTRRIARNGARIELIACRETVEALMAQGLDKKKIHTRLTENGQFTMSYAAFCKLAIKVAVNGLPVQTLMPSVSSPTHTEGRQSVTPIRPQRQPGIIKSGPEPFPDPKNIDPKTLI